MNRKNTFKRQHHTSAAESRFTGIMNRLRRQRDLKREQQVEAAHIINKIQSYGFSFFPNHYLWEDLDRLDTIANA